MRLPLFAAAALCAFSLAAHADTVYNYVGQDFAYVAAPYTTMDKVTGSFTVANPIAANYSGRVVTTSFTFNDGVQTISNANTTRWAFDLTTDAEGDITSYLIDVGPPEGETMMRLEKWNYPGVGDFGRDFAISIDGGYADFGAVNLPGDITEAPALPTGVTPEPSSFALLGTGLLGVVGVTRKRFA